MKKSINKLINIFLCIIFFILFFGGSKAKFASIEDLDIYMGASYTMEKIGKDLSQYIIGATSNMYKGENKVESENKIGRAVTISGTREDRQRKIGKEFFLGLVKLYLIDEDYAKYGVQSTLDILFKNSIINDNGAFAICSGKSENYYELKQEGYENNAEYIYEMVKNAAVFNFFGKNYTLKNAVLCMNSEGKNIAAPHIKLTENGFFLDGIGIFKKEKLAIVLNMDETRIMNMLREDKSKGVLTIQRNPQDYVDFDTKVKRKVKCTKIGNKYNFTIELQLKGDVLNNLMYKEMTGKIDVIKDFEKDMEKNIEKKSNEFINKMQHEYKIDCLQLGWVAAGKYGRDSGVDWDEIISKSDINVKVKVKIDKLGRGEFRVEE